MTRVSAIEVGSVVRYAAPEDGAEAEFRFIVREVNGDRLMMQATAASMPGWSRNLLPVEMVATSDVEVCDE